MKLLSLNIWGASQGKIFFDYIAQQSVNTDIFCFQEVFEGPKEFKFDPLADGTHPRLFTELSEALKDFVGFYAVTSKHHSLKTAVQNLSHGLAIFVHKKHVVTEQNFSLIHGSQAQEVKLDFTNLPCILQYAHVGNLNVFNYHGIPMPGDKLDTKERIAASQKILEVMAKTSGPKILCGDFNLMPDTESVRMFGEAGFKNLIKDFKITNTRNEISWNMYSNKQSFADFTFISPEIKVKSFEVPYNLVSDHLPMVMQLQI